MPTRFAKQLVQLLRGAVAIGMTPAEGMRLAMRCARDTIPPLRRDILLDLANNPSSRAADVRKRISKPRNTVRRELEGMHMLGLLRCDETEEIGKDGKAIHDLALPPGRRLRRGNPAHDGRQAGRREAALSPDTRSKNVSRIYGRPPKHGLRSCSIYINIYVSHISGPSVVLTND